MKQRINPILTEVEHQALTNAREHSRGQISLSLDIGKTKSCVIVEQEHWVVADESFPFLTRCRPETFYYWDGEEFLPLSVFEDGLVKLVPTRHGPPTFHLDGVKMLPSAQVDPFIDAKTKVHLIKPQGNRILDTCGGLGYFAHWCLDLGAEWIQSYEKSEGVIWLRGHNSWSPDHQCPSVKPRFELHHGDILNKINDLRSASFGAILHDPPRFALAGELYSLGFYRQLRRVLRKNGRMFHYTGTPNKKTTGRDVPGEVMKRLNIAGFQVERKLDGILAIATS